MTWGATGWMFRGGATGPTTCWPASGPSQEALDQAGVQSPDVEVSVGATGIVMGNGELDISIGSLIDLALYDGANTDSAEFFRQRLRFIRQAWEHQRGNSRGWYRRFAFPWPVPVRIMRHPSDVTLDRIEYVWFGAFWRRYVTTTEGNGAGGDRYIIEHVPAWKKEGLHWLAIEPHHTHKSERWRSEEREG